MEGKFVLTINLGNEAMQTPGDIAYALTRAAQDVQSGYGAGRVWDVFGNTVGSFDITEEEA